MRRFAIINKYESGFYESINTCLTGMYQKKGNQNRELDQNC